MTKVVIYNTENGMYWSAKGNYVFKKEDAIQFPWWYAEHIFLTQTEQLVTVSEEIHHVTNSSQNSSVEVSPDLEPGVVDIPSPGINSPYGD